MQPDVIAFAMRNRADLLLFLTATLCSAQAPARAPAGPTTRYHDDSMNFDFVYPSSFTTDDVPRKEQGKGRGAEKADPGCVSDPVAVMDMRTGFNMIFLKRYDQACLSKEITAAGLGTAAANVLTDTLEQFGKPAISSSTDYDITGHSASAVFGSVKVPHASGKSVIYGAASCVISGKNIACFQFLSNDCPTLAVLSPAPSSSQAPPRRPSSRPNSRPPASYSRRSYILRCNQMTRLLSLVCLTVLCCWN